MCVCINFTDLTLTYMHILYPENTLWLWCMCLAWLYWCRKLLYSKRNRISKISWALEDGNCRQRERERGRKCTVVYHHRKIGYFYFISNAKTFRKIKLCYANVYTHVCVFVPFFYMANIWWICCGETDTKDLIKSYPGITNPGVYTI